MNTRQINRDPDYRRHREQLQEEMQDPSAGANQNIDDKISKLQSLLQMAKGGK